MNHSDSSFDHSHAAPHSSGDRATTRELALPSPARPTTTSLLVVMQVLLVALGLVLLAISVTAALAFLAVAFVATPFTLHGWRWRVKYPKARLLTGKKLEKATPGTWIVRPGSKYAVVIKDQPVGTHANPTIADGLTREELAIIAPVYAFTQVPKGSKAS